MSPITSADVAAMDDVATWAATWAVNNVTRPKPSAQAAVLPAVAANYLALQQSLANYRAAGRDLNRRHTDPDPLGLNRADKLLLDASSVAATGASEIGLLRGIVRKLCAEIECLSNPDSTPAAAACGEKWASVDVRGDADFGNALVRCFYDSDIDGDGELRAVYLGGYDITQALAMSTIIQLEAAMEAERAVTAEEHIINAVIFRLES